METVIYESIPNQAKEIGQKVFVDEQGFHNEFDDIEFGDIDDDEGCPHIWMKKSL